MVCSRLTFAKTSLVIFYNLFFYVLFKNTNFDVYKKLLRYYRTPAIDLFISRFSDRTSFDTLKSIDNQCGFGVSELTYN